MLRRRAATVCEQAGWRKFAVGRRDRDSSAAEVEADIHRHGGDGLYRGWGSAVTLGATRHDATLLPGRQRSASAAGVGTAQSAPSESLLRAQSRGSGSGSASRVCRPPRRAQSAAAMARTDDVAAVASAFAASVVHIAVDGHEDDFALAMAQAGARAVSSAEEIMHDGRDGDLQGRGAIEEMERPSTSSGSRSERRRRVPEGFKTGVESSPSDELRGNTIADVKPLDGGSDDGLTAGMARRRASGQVGERERKSDARSRPDYTGSALSGGIVGAKEATEAIDKPQERTVRGLVSPYTSDPRRTFGLHQH